MSNNWVDDIEKMHVKYGVDKWVSQKIDDTDLNSLKEFLKFRIKFLDEELAETTEAFANEDPEEIVDGLIDLCVVAIGTLQAFGVNSHKAWNAVLTANMSKEIGVKPTRPNPLGLPDLVKPEAWTAPSHAENHGILAKIFT